jgi:hypothetical protein
LAAVEEPEFVAGGDGLLRGGAADHTGTAEEEDFHGKGSGGRDEGSGEMRNERRERERTEEIFRGVGWFR